MGLDDGVLVGLCVVGAKLGLLVVGFRLGRIAVGIFVGRDVVGSEVGEAVGIRVVGRLVGLRVVGVPDVGFAEGNALGFLVGVRLGANVGLAVDDTEGLLLGLLDEGLLVGWEVGMDGGGCTRKMSRHGKTRCKLWRQIRLLTSVHIPRVDTWLYIDELTRRGSNDTSPERFEFE